MTKILGEIDIDPVLKAQAFLGAALQVAKSQLEKAGAIQAFEVCYELAWKTMKRVLAYRGIIASSPREVFRHAAQEKLIADPEIWFEFIVKRNLTTHVYNPAVAEEVFHFLPVFAKEFDKFIQKIKNL